MNEPAVNQSNKRSMNVESKNLYLFESLGFKYIFNKCLVWVMVDKWLLMCVMYDPTASDVFRPRFIGGKFILVFLMKIIWKYKMLPDNEDDIATVTCLLFSISITATCLDFFPNFYSTCWNKMDSGLICVYH